MKKDVADKILSDVAATYERIALSFSATRPDLWPDLEFLFDDIPGKANLLDAGCGNGRLLGYLKKKKNLFYTGVDVSAKLLSIAEKKYESEINSGSAVFKEGSILNLPFEDESFDILTSVAVMHHIPSNKYRKQAASEIKRVLKPGGKAIVTTWNLWQKKYRKYIYEEALKILTMRSELDFFDCYIPWKKDGDALQRYCHAFVPKTLKKLLSADFMSVEAGYTSRDAVKPNVYATAYRGS